MSALSPSEDGLLASSQTGQASLVAEPVDTDLEAFVAVCERLGAVSDHLHAEWIDGYLTALAVPWRTLTIDDVLGPLLEDSAQAVQADEALKRDLTEVLGSRLQELRASLDPESLLDDPDTMRLSPLMQIWDEEARGEVRDREVLDEADLATLLTGADWARGFMSATIDFADDWPGAEQLHLDDESTELLTQLLETVAALAMDPASDEFKAFARAGWQDAQPSRDDLINEACYAIQDLRLWWLDHAPSHAPRRVEAQPGRNDPCPCGSGKKFKKCHGA